MSDVPAGWPPPAELPTVKQCSLPPYGCGQVRPISEFKEGETRCKKCMGRKPDKNHATLRRRARKKVLRGFMRNLIKKERGDVINVPHISEVAAGMTRLFGGLDGFCSQWYGEIQAARASEKGAGSKRVLDAFNNIARLIKFSTENRESAPDAQNMTDEQLADAVMTTIAQRLNSMSPAEQLQMLESMSGEMVDEMPDEADDYLEFDDDDDEQEFDPQEPPDMGQHE